MAGSTFGSAFQITTWGESHGSAVGVVIDGCPAGLALCAEDIDVQLCRRRPGTGAFASQRREADRAQILSGVFEGKTTGTPIAIMIENTDARSADYEEMKDIYRPSHADFVYEEKYGHRDYRGGGRSSGRETAARVAAGAVARKLLSQRGIEVFAYVCAIGEIEIDRGRLDLHQAERNDLRIPDWAAYEAASEMLEAIKAEGDSVGGIVECVAKQLPVGLGEPVFDKLDAQLAKAILSIGGVKGIEIGSGFAAARMKGSEHNDALYTDEGGQVAKRTNHSGGITGGLSDGGTLVLRAAVKPTPSIQKPQKTVRRNGKNATLEMTGRHDVVIAPRVAVVVEAMVCLVLADFLLIDQGRR